MDSQKIINLLDDTTNQPPKVIIRNKWWITSNI